ncbi:MAG: glycosyltransferase family 2 protein [bacterium]|nr:glycosyltransferase family 2 protein [bacterium]
MKISVVVPVYNEEESLEELHNRLISVLKGIKIPFEIIFIDDGSSDRTYEKMSRLSPLVSIRLTRNCGQTAALSAGIDAATGDIIATIDGDLENYPEDIPLLLEKINEGFDIVSGWRKNRWKGHFTRRFPSLVANWLISYVSKIKLHDHGCALKAYKAGAIKQLKLYGDMHRMIAAYAAQGGKKIIELQVRHEPRKYGVSKYGLWRTFRVLLDLIVVKFFSKYSSRPMHFFGGAGFFSVFLGFLTFLVMIYLKYFRAITFIQTPLPILAIFFVLVGSQFILMGLLAEILTRLYYESQKKTVYNIAEKQIH